MPMSERVAQLRQQSLDATPSISSERAELLTEFYHKNSGLMSAPVRRARAAADPRRSCRNNSAIPCRLSGQQLVAVH